MRARSPHGHRKNHVETVLEFVLFLENLRKFLLCGFCPVGTGHTRKGAVKNPGLLGLPENLRVHYAATDRLRAPLHEEHLAAVRGGMRFLFQGHEALAERSVRSEGYGDRDEDLRGMRLYGPASHEPHGTLLV